MQLTLSHLSILSHWPSHWKVDSLVLTFKTVPQINLWICQLFARSFTQNYHWFFQPFRIPAMVLTVPTGSVFSLMLPDMPLPSHSFPHLGLPAFCQTLQTPSYQRHLLWLFFLRENILLPDVHWLFFRISNSCFPLLSCLTPYSASISKMPRTE